MQFSVSSLLWYPGHQAFKHQSVNLWKPYLVDFSCILIKTIIFWRKDKLNLKTLQKYCKDTKNWWDILIIFQNYILQRQYYSITLVSLLRFWFWFIKTFFVLVSLSLATPDSRNWINNVSSLDMTGSQDVRNHFS